MNRILSICIPTYNREKFLNELIESIINDIDDDLTDSIEICISDNASADNTAEMISGWTNRTDVKIVYHRNEKNLGADLNYLKAVEIAEGSFCWFIGSDDAVIPGKTRYIIEALREDYDIYLYGRRECTYELKPVSDKCWLNAKIVSKVYNLSDRDGLIEYFNDAQSIGAIFSYLSSIVFKRGKWDMIEYDSKFTGTAYSHVFMLLSFIKSGCVLRYDAEPVVLCRSDNDAFGQDGAYKRFMLDIDGYRLISENLGFISSDQDVKRSFLKILTREKSVRALLTVRTGIVNKDDLNKFFIGLKYYTFSKTVRFILKLKMVLLLSRFLLFLKESLKR